MIPTPPQDAYGDLVELTRFYALVTDPDDRVRHIVYPVKFGCDPKNPSAQVITSEGASACFTQERFGLYARISTNISVLSRPTRTWALRVNHGRVLDDERAGAHAAKAAEKSTQPEEHPRIENAHLLFGEQPADPNRVF